ncbi:MAG: hypothetical protein M3480_10885 [Verrucomicrobiota bacterium]|nr:hypothetical protein [Chthoniobacterales bacterium]MDQ3415453.1 hypothetical protein [Verrucomicrobiota bacterium]
MSPDRFPKYSPVQLLALGDVRRPMREQIIDLARAVPLYIELFSRSAKEHSIYIVAGTAPVFDAGRDKVYNDSTGVAAGNH